MLVTVFLLSLILILFLRGFKKPKNYPPGPIKLPMVGFIPFWPSRNAHKLMKSMEEQYGPVIGIFMGSDPAVIVNSYEPIKSVLFNDDLNGRPEGGLNDDRTWGKTLGVMFTNGETWQKQRRFSLHQFRNLGFGKTQHEDIILDDLKDTIQEISQTKGPINLQAVIGVSAINVVWAILGGTRFKRGDPRLANMVDIINKIFQAGKPFGNIVNVFPFLKKINPIVEWTGYNQIIQHFIQVRDFLMESIEEHKKTFNENDIRDFFDSYLYELKYTQDTSFTEQQLVGVAMDVFSASVETTASLVSFCIMFMCLYPEVQIKVQKELDEVIGTNRLATTSDKSKLLYTDAVYHEVFRIRCPASLTVPHTATKDTTVMGYNIPAGTLFFINLYSLMMDSKHWGDPENFRPERFIKDGKIIKDDTFMPFGKGKRACLGEPLARMTTFLIFCGLMQKFSFSLDPNTPLHDTEGSLGFTLSPPHFNVIVKNRF